MEHAQGICDLSGFKYPLRDLVKQRDGSMVHYRFADKPHPSDYPRPPRVERPLPYSRPEGEDVFLDIGEVSAADL
jgi:hypothetical protein